MIFIAQHTSIRLENTSYQQLFRPKLFQTLLIKLVNVLTENLLGKSKES